MDLFLYSQYLSQVSTFILNPQHVFQGHKYICHKRDNLGAQKFAYNNCYISTQGSFWLYFKSAILEFKCNDEEKIKYVFPFTGHNQRLLFFLSIKNKGTGTKIKITTTKQTMKIDLIMKKFFNSCLSHRDLLGNLHLA